MCVSNEDFDQRLESKTHRIELNSSNQHLQMRSVYELNDKAKTLNQMVRSPLGLISIGMDYLINQGGALSMAPSQLGAFARSSESVATPDLQCAFNVRCSEEGKRGKCRLIIVVPPETDHIQPLSLDSWDKPLHPYPVCFASRLSILHPALGNAGHQKLIHHLAPPTQRESQRQCVICGRQAAVASLFGLPIL